MRIVRLLTGKMIATFVIVASILVPLSVTADDALPKGVVQVWTAVEGNLKFYVKEGDKVKKGDPLFFVTTCDNNTAMYFETISQLRHQRKLFERRKRLIETHAVSQEEYDDAYEDLITAEAELISYLVKVQLGFYRAPFDCEIVKLLYVQGSGVGDGNPVINIKPTDPNYKFNPTKPSKLFLDVMKLSDEWLDKRIKGFNIEEFKKTIEE